MAGLSLDTTLVTGLLNAGVAGVVALLFVLGIIYPRSVVSDLKEERDALKAAVASERDRADSAVAAATASRDMMAALQAGVTMGQHLQHAMATPDAQALNARAAGAHAPVLPAPGAPGAGSPP